MCSLKKKKKKSQVTLQVKLKIPDFSHFLKISLKQITLKKNSNNPSNKSRCLHRNPYREQIGTKTAANMHLRIFHVGTIPTGFWEGSILIKRCVKKWKSKESKTPLTRYKMRNNHAETGSKEDSLRWYKIAEESQVLLHHSLTSIQPRQSLRVGGRDTQKKYFTDTMRSAFKVLNHKLVNDISGQLTNKILISCSNSLVKYMMEERNSNSQLMIWSSLRQTKKSPVKITKSSKITEKMIPILHQAPANNI